MDFYLLGQRIRQERIKHRYTQASIAEKLDISTNYMGQIERGDRKPSLETLVDICNVLGTNLDYLLSDNITVEDDLLTADILTQLKLLDNRGKAFIHNVISAYLEAITSNPAEIN